MGLVALLTDFGARDHYVAAMKGVILTIAPGTTLIDITHEIPPQDIVSGAFELAACFRYFPSGTVFLVVVDPGVGTSRRAIAISAGHYLFVGPDNGVLAPALEDDARVVELKNAEYALADISHTFEGRDRFAPAAAWLAKGIDIRRLGPDLADPVRTWLPAPTFEPSRVNGEIVKADRFGNLVSNIEGGDLERLPEPLSVRIGAVDVGRVVRTYGDAAKGQVVALVGSSGYLEIAVSGGSAADRLGCGRGEVVVVQGASSNHPPR